MGGGSEFQESLTTELDMEIWEYGCDTEMAVILRDEEVNEWMCLKAVGGKKAPCLDGRTH